MLCRNILERPLCASGSREGLPEEVAFRRRPAEWEERPWEGCRGAFSAEGTAWMRALRVGKSVGWPKNREKARGEQSGEVVSKVLCSRTELAQVLGRGTGRLHTTDHWFLLESDNFSQHEGSPRPAGTAVEEPALAHRVPGSLLLGEGGS